MIARALILKKGTTCDGKALKLTGPFDPTFLTDTVKFNELLAVMIRPTPGWDYIKPKRGGAPNGGRNYRIISEHYVILWNIDPLVGNASRGLQHLKWSRDGRTWNWDDCVSAHVTEQNIIEGLIVNGYAGIDNRTKVSYLCNGMKSSALSPV